MTTFDDRAGLLKARGCPLPRTQVYNLEQTPAPCDIYPSSCDTLSSFRQIRMMLSPSQQAFASQERTYFADHQQTPVLTVRRSQKSPLHITPLLHSFPTRQIAHRPHFSPVSTPPGTAAPRTQLSGQPAAVLHECDLSVIYTASSTWQGFGALNPGSAAAHECASTTGSALAAGLASISNDLTLTSHRTTRRRPRSAEFDPRPYPCPHQGCDARFDRPVSGQIK